MEKTLFPIGVINVELHGEKRLAQYMGRQEGFECVVCGKGENCYTFNFFNSPEQYANGEYETMGFGRSHINAIKLLP